jgi:hypothetical protein
MPCITEPDYEYERRQEAERRKPAAVLCGILAAHGPALFDAVNWQEVGVPRKWAEKWWAEHRLKDERRHKAERDKAAAEAEYGPETTR